MAPVRNEIMYLLEEGSFDALPEVKLWKRCVPSYIWSALSIAASCSGASRNARAAATYEREEGGGERERERERDRETERQRDRETERQRERERDGEAVYMHHVPCRPEARRGEV